MIHSRLSLLVSVLTLCSPTFADRPVGAESQASQVDLAEKIEFFERKVRPLLAAHCYSCHSVNAETVHGGLLLDSAAALTSGGDSGPAVVAGQPDASLLLKAVRYEGGFEMPPKGKLRDPQIAILQRWINEGAVFPASNNQQTTDDNGAIDFEQGRQFWSFQPVRKQPVPAVDNQAWPRQRLDFFIAAAHQRHGLKPAPRSDRATLARRLYFSLLGVPPTPDQLDAFLNDQSPNAYRRLVDRLLASPQYGERWARWWLDLARYTDRTASWLFPTGQAHLYRDWVVAALNDDLPYNEFIRRQLATDLMPHTDVRDLPALGFLSLSPTYWKELKLPCEVIKTIVADEWEERVDAVSRTFLGLTVACARCHDHKFDPISSEDYYALAGVFASCRQVERPLMDEAEYAPVRAAKQKVAALEKELSSLRKAKPSPQAKIDQLTAQIDTIRQQTPGYDTPIVSALAEESMFVVRAGAQPDEGTRLEYRAEPRDLPKFVRGNPNRPGPIVPRRFLTVLSGSQQPFRNGSGRLELAEAITTEGSSLAARVIVNRLWHAHFGSGIVATPSNFGSQGSPPTHPQLLDDLAARFIAGGWSLKKLHREILLSATWQQASTTDEASTSADPNNRWLTRMSRRRLDYEAWRDAMLVATSSGDFRIGGPSVPLDDPGNFRRTLYATIHRRDMSPTLTVHDFPDPTQHSPARISTITAIQGLYALNGPLLIAQAEEMTHRVFASHASTDRDRIREVYRRLFLRLPTKQELDLGIKFLGGNGVDEEDAATASRRRWPQYIHVLLASNEFSFLD